MTLKELRIKHQLTLKALSTHIGISLSSLHKYENGVHKIPKKSKEALEQYFNEPIDAPNVITIHDYKCLLKHCNQLQESYNKLEATYNDLLYDHHRLKTIIKNIYNEVQYDGSH